MTHAAQALHLAVRYGLRSAAVTASTALGTLVGAACALGSWAYLRAAAAPSYGPTLELIDGGADLSRATPAQALAKDVVWAWSALLPLTAATSWGWALALPALAYMAWAAYQAVVAPMLRLAASQRPADAGASGGAQTDRAAKRAARRRQKWN